MKSPINVWWTQQSFTNARSIKEYLLRKFTEREVSNFENLLKDFEKMVTIFPHLYPKSNQKPHIRKAVLHKFTSVYYVEKSGEIIVIAIHDNRQKED